jgi:alpha-1,6-mannosyltransferase
MTPNRSRSVWLDGAGAVLAIAFALLAWLSHRGLSVWVWLGLIALAWLALLFGWRAAKAVPPSSIVLRLWFWAVVLRVIGFFGQPIFEDDYFRFLWDGRLFAVSGNPYGVPPIQFFADASVPDSFQSVLNGINHPDVPTIYGPICQFVFLLGYWISPAQLWPIKVVLIAADLGVLWLLLKITAPKNALLYAGCPLLIQETAFSAHPENLGVIAIVAALWAKQQGRWFLVGVFCALGVAARIHAVLLVPFLMWPWRWKSIAMAAFTLVACYAPFWIQGSGADLAGLRAFAGEWEFNSSLFALAKVMAGWNTAKLICHGAFVLFFAWWFHRQRNAALVRADLIYGVFFLLSAVVNPWYLLWLVPFVALNPSTIGLTALMAVSLSYLHAANLGLPNLGPYDHPKWLRPLEYGLILAAALVQWRRNLFAAKRKTG